MKRLLPMVFCCVAALPAAAQIPQNRQESPAVLPTYVTVATAVASAPFVIDARIADVIRIKDSDAAGLAPGRARLYVQADVLALIRGSHPLPAQISYLAEVPLDSRGKVPKLKKQRVLLFARDVAGQPGQVQLTGLDRQFAWSAPLDERVRTIVRDLLAPNAPPAVTGVGNAFHVPGTLPGEGETQVFLKTSTGAPISLQILRRPGEQTRWAVSLGDIVDNAAGAPAHDTLLWYRLACGLPRTLPDDAVASEEPANAAAAREDYALVLRDLGPCN